MIIEHDSVMAQEFTKIMLTAYYDRSVTHREGFHRSDVIACPLKAYWRLTGEVEIDLGPDDVGIFLLGELCHIALHKYFDAQEKHYDLGGVAVTVDAIFKNAFPIETKSTRKKIYRKEDLLNEWIEQLGIAMSIMHINTGYLMVMNIISFSLNIWKVTLSDEELIMFGNSCQFQAFAIGDSVQKRDPSILQPKFDECKYCSYRPKPRKGKIGCRFYRKPPKEAD
jgi:hypothetical protein